MASNDSPSLNAAPGSPTSSRRTLMLRYPDAGLLVPENGLVHLDDTDCGPNLQMYV